jgi:hypothetical protein
MRPNNHTIPNVTAIRVEDAGAIWFATECRRNGVRLESCIRRAQLARDPELVEFFRRSQKLANSTAS